MAMINHILFPFDFSKQGLLAAPFVRAIASRFEARITLIGVIPPAWAMPSADLPAMVTVDIEEMKRDLESRLDATLSNEFPGLAVRSVTTLGDPAQKITEFAHSNAVDLIMMPTHGFGLYRSLLIGSVTAKVLHDAKCPVWTATHAEEQRSRDMPRTILCAVDGTSRTPALMQWAAELSQGMGASLKLLHVAPRISDWLPLPGERELQEQVRNEARAKIDALRQDARVETTVRVAVGQIVDTVTEEARQEGADLVLIGRGSLQSPLGRLRTHTYGIIQKSPCPVVSV
jgi:nucleotide-binding universal stress UspA family protein